MSDTLQNIKLIANTWIDLYAETGITVGTQIVTSNLTTTPVKLFAGAVVPAGAENNNDTGSFNRLMNYAEHVNDEGATGAWAFSQSEGLISVKASAAPTVLTSDGVKNSVIASDRAGREGMYSIPGELHVGFKTDDISVNFQYGISTSDIKDGGSVTGTGVVSSTGSMAFVSTGVGVGTAEIQSLPSIRYRAGHEVQGAMSIVLAALEINVNQYAGFLNTDDGWAVGSKDLDYGIWFIEGGNFNFVAQSTWNIDKVDGTGLSKYNANFEKAQLYRFSYAWHGFLPLILEMYQPLVRKWIPVHAMEFINTAIETHLENPNLPLACRIERTSGTGADLKIGTGSWRGGVVAGVEEDNNSNRWFPAFRLSLTKTANPDFIIAIKSKTIFNGKNNHIKVRVKLIASINSTNKELVFKTTRLSQLDAGDQAAIDAGFVDVNTLNSTMQVSKVTRALTTVLTEEQVGDVAVVRSADTVRNTDVQGFDIYPGGDAIFFVEHSGTAANGTVSFQMNFVELF